MKSVCLTVLLLCSTLLGVSQLRVNGSWLIPDSIPNKSRNTFAYSAIGGGYVLSMTALGFAWYANEKLSSFHFFDDLHQWKQVDKFGHAYGGYVTSSLFMDMHIWSGMSRNKAMWLGSLEGFAAMSSIEIFDGFGEAWGFSWSDVGANLLGVSLTILNESLWQDRRIQLKWNYLRSPYAGDPAFERLFGTTYPEWVLKDYNGQSYWLGIRIQPFLPEGQFKEHFPAWLNLGLGYGAYGLEGGYDDPNGSWTTREYRQWYLSLDLDMSQIRVRNPALQQALLLLNYVRIPLPALRFDRYGVGFDGLR